MLHYTVKWVIYYLYSLLASSEIQKEISKGEFVVEYGPGSRTYGRISLSKLEQSHDSLEGEFVELTEQKVYCILLCSDVKPLFVYQMAILLFLLFGLPIAIEMLASDWTSNSSSLRYAHISNSS